MFILIALVSNTALAQLFFNSGGIILPNATIAHGYLIASAIATSTALSLFELLLVHTLSDMTGSGIQYARWEWGKRILSLGFISLYNIYSLALLELCALAGEWADATHDTWVARALADWPWAYILKNPSITIVLRRKPLGGIVAQVRFGSECLWRRTPEVAFREANALIKTLWGHGKGSWQVSQAHLCHDVMHAPIEIEHLSRYVSRSRTGAMYEALRAQLEASGFNEEDLLAMGVTDDEIFGDFGDDDDPLWALGDEIEMEPDAVESREVVAYRWGKRLSGVAWSLRSAVAFVQYDKLLETHRTGRVHMHAIWKEQGWTGTEPVTRHEARLRRAAFRSLHLPDGSHLLAAES